MVLGLTTWLGTGIMAARGRIGCFAHVKSWNSYLAGARVFQTVGPELKALTEEEIS